MRKTYLILLAVFGFLFLMGCTVPQYHPCCLYTQASEGRCVVNNGTEYETDFCDMENLTCNVTIEQITMITGGMMGPVPVTTEAKLTVPICPQRQSGKCNVSCAGIFCGRFEFDPRPLFSTSDAVVLDENDNPSPNAERMTEGSQGGDAIGLYNAECRLENMTPAFMNTMTNGQGITLNIFRFGIGDSFQEFDEASMYYPLTDKACQLNTRGSVDRYENYAIPNRLNAAGGELCQAGGVLTPSGEITTYFCNADETIRSYSYQDCAIRCALYNSGDSPAVDAGNAYPTERNGQTLGNPFAYGINWRHMHGSPMEWAYSYPSTDKEAYPMSQVIGRDIKSSVLPESSFEDEYSLGYDYYGAEFGREDSYISKQSGGWERYVTVRGTGTFGNDILYDYYSGVDTATPDLKWDGEAVEEFLTVGRDPHGIYAYLLPRHSVYSGQILNGHYTMGGEWKQGAEFECTVQGGECVSGFCNIADYHRGTCQNLENTSLDANCDCRQEGGGTVCDVKKVETTKAFDNPDKNIQVAMTLGAIVDSGGARTSMPAIGRVISYDPGVYTGEMTGEKVQALVMLMGGNEYPTFDAFAYSDALDDRNETLTIPQVLSRSKWGGCGAYSDCGKFYTTFVDACMPDFPDPEYANLEICYRYDIAGQAWQQINPSTGALEYFQPSLCQGLRDLDAGSAAGRGGTDGKTQTDHDVFCYARRTDGKCTAAANAALVIAGRPVTYEVNGEEVEGTAIGNCLIDGNGNLITKTYGYCDQCSFLTMAKETIVSLPEDTADPGYEKGAGDRMGNKYCPTTEISTIFPPWEIASLGSSPNPDYGTWAVGGIHMPDSGEATDPYRYSQCSMPDMTEAGDHLAWPDYLPEAYYLKSKIESYLKRNIQPVIFADDAGLYRVYTPESSPRFVLDAYITSSGEADTLDTTRTDHPLLMETWNKNPFLIYEFAYGGFENQHPEDHITSGTYLANSIYNQGPAIVVIRKFNMSDMDTIYYLTDGTAYRNIDEMLYMRGRALRLLCPNCMLSVAVGYDTGPEGGSGAPARMRQLSYLFGYSNATTGEPRWDYEYYGLNDSCVRGEASCDLNVMNQVDMVAVKWELDTHNSHCNITNEEERFAAIVADEAEFGSRVLKRFGKPLVVTDFSIMRNRVGSCWTDENAKNFMAYLGMHADELVKSGHTGLIYSDWTEWGSTDPKTTYIRTEENGVLSYRGDFFEGTFTAASLFAGKKEQTAYSMVYVTENCTCTPCTYIDDPNVCNGRFKGTGDTCEGYVDGAFVKWPDKCVSANVCIPPSALPGYRVSCNSYYMNGTEVQENFSGSEIAANPQLYPDVIASIKLGGKIPCAETQGKNISYLQLLSGGYKPFPLLFRKDGDMNYTCGEPSFDSFAACGVSVPVTDRRMDCVIAPNDLEIMLPPIGVGITGPGSLPSGATGGIGTIPRGIGGIGG